MAAASKSIPFIVPPQVPAVLEPPTSAVPRRALAIRAAHNHTPGVRTFYVASESHPGTEYVAQFIRRAHQRRWFCNCPDFTFRRLPHRRHCKHLHELTARAREADGVSRLAGGVS
jgi:hypothetical protein